MRNLTWLLMLLLIGCSVGVDPSGEVGSYQTIEEFTPSITKGATTREELIAALGEPSSQMVTSDSEIVMFAEGAPFWEAGGFTSLVMGRQQRRTLTVTLQNGVVSDYTLTGAWTRR